VRGRAAVVEERRQRAEADQGASGPAVGGGRHEQGQTGVEALELARLEERRDHA
jgi:hypothetical protein